MVAIQEEKRGVGTLRNSELDTYRVNLIADITNMHIADARAVESYTCTCRARLFP